MKFKLNLNICRWFEFTYSHEKHGISIILMRSVIKILIRTEMQSLDLRMVKQGFFILNPSLCIFAIILG